MLPVCIPDPQPMFAAMPPHLIEAVRAAAEGRALSELTASASRLSEHYRARGSSRAVIGAESDAVAYALSRMPATFAAVTAALTELVGAAPDFTPATLLDAGAGPGTATWAAQELWPDLAATLIDESQPFLDLARTISPNVTTRRDDLARFELGTRFDLVTCAYALTELDDAAAESAVKRLWRHTSAALLLIEPGRPRDYERLLRFRAQVLGQGADLLGPCPHQAQCPLSAPDWCHFSVRLNRSRDHRHLKQASLGYEDEKFSYLLLARPGIGRPAASRIIKPPRENKFSVTLPLCTEAGEAEDRTIQKRDGAAFRSARKAGWGDAWPER